MAKRCIIRSTLFPSLYNQSIIIWNDCIAKPTMIIFIGTIQCQNFRGFGFSQENSSLPKCP
uniref:Uncharacterized protein n=1 Tax=Anguilla anguilla TaxID=7936 RepID=A0A0E9WQD2_ANGAN